MNDSKGGQKMKLNCVNIPTTNVDGMRDFYVMALKAEYDQSHGGLNRCEILTKGATLVLCKTAVPPVINPDSCGLEFVVDDVDAEYERLLAAGVKFDRPPVTYPWGWRAIGFKDPDGNNIDFVQNMGTGD